MAIAANQEPEPAAITRYKRVLLKISGEALMGDQGFGLHPPTVQRVAEEVKSVHDLGVEICRRHLGAVLPHAGRIRVRFGEHDRQIVVAREEMQNQHARRRLRNLVGQGLDLLAEGSGNVTSALVPYSAEKNLATIEAGLKAKKVTAPGGDAIDARATYPESLSCTFD